MTKTKPCNRSHASARLAIAESFMEAAELPQMLANDKNVYRGNAQVANYIQAGIAAADAICCIELKEHSWASYGTGPMTDKVTRAQRAAEKLVRAARDRLAS